MIKLVREGKDDLGESTWEPVLEGRKVGPWWLLAGLEGLYGTARVHGDGETGGAADTLLGCGNDGIDLPIIEENVFGADTADAVHDQEGLWRDSLDQLGQRLQVAENTSGGINMSNSQKLVLLLLQCLLDLWELWTVSNGGLKLSHIRAVDAEAFCKRIAEVASVKDEDVVARLGEVGGDKIPAQSAGAGDDEGLRCWICGLEELTEHSQGLAESFDECWSRVTLAVRRSQLAFDQTRMAVSIAFTMNHT
jgi:hypothetical protein